MRKLRVLRVASFDGALTEGHAALRMSFEVAIPTPAARQLHHSIVGTGLYFISARSSTRCDPAQGAGVALTAARTACVPPLNAEQRCCSQIVTTIIAHDLRLFARQESTLRHAGHMRHGVWLACAVCAAAVS